MITFDTEHTERTERSTPRAVFVLGPESSGTRLATEILINGGCEGSTDEHQPFDSSPPLDTQPLIVWRRSIPHDRKLLNIGSMIEWCGGYGRRMFSAVVLHRDWSSMVESQLRHGHVLNARQSKLNIRLAYSEMWVQLLRFGLLNETVTLSYEQLSATPQSVQLKLWNELGLSPGEFVNILQGNARYHGGYGGA